MIRLFRHHAGNVYSEDPGEEEELSLRLQEDTEGIKRYSKLDALYPAPTGWVYVPDLPPPSVLAQWWSQAPVDVAAFNRDLEQATRQGISEVLASVEKGQAAPPSGAAQETAPAADPARRSAPSWEHKLPPLAFVDSIAVFQEDDAYPLPLTEETRMEQAIRVYRDGMAWYVAGQMLSGRKASTAALIRSETPLAIMAGVSVGGAMIALIIQRVLG